MLEMVFLGTGSGIPTARRNHPSIYFRHEGDVFLWDCGEGTQRQLLLAGLNFMKVNRIFITHWHADHWAGIISIMQTMSLESRKDPLYIYGPEAERFIGDILDLDYWGPRFRVVAKDVPAQGSKVTDIFETKDYVIGSIPVKHSVPAVAYSFRERDKVNLDIEKAGKLYGIKQGRVAGELKEKGEVVFKGRKIRLKDVALVRKGVKVVYSGDTAPCRNLVEISRGADVLIHDSTFTEEKENRLHAGAKEAADIAKKAGVKKLVLTHFSRRYTDLKPLLEEAQKAFKDTIVAKDFMKLRV
jgi:ribonuclease Z